MNDNMVSENRVLRERIGAVEEEMFEMQDAMRRQAEKTHTKEEEMGIKRMKASNRNLMERVEFLQKREKELMDALKK